MYTQMKIILPLKTVIELDRTTVFDDISFGLYLSTLRVLDVIVDGCRDVNELLIKTTSSLTELLLNNKRKTEDYKVSKVLEIAGEYLDTSLGEHASELSFYRRFAMLIDIIFTDIDITLSDGEIVAEATKMAQQQSAHYAISWFGRKFDLLLMVKGSKIVMACNEWKSHKTKDQYIHQQSKNFRSNCSILNEIFIKSNRRIDKLVAIDFLGAKGYMYCPSLKDNVSIANTISTLLMPTDITHMKSFKKTLTALFKRRDFMNNSIFTLKKFKAEQELSDVIRSSTSDSAVTLTPLLFFTPKNARVKEAAMMEDQEEYYKKKSTNFLKFLINIISVVLLYITEIH